MKFLTIAFVLISFHLASAQSLKTSKYQGRADGAIQLNTKKGSALLSDSNLEITVKRVSALSSPVQFFKGGRVIVLKSATDTFKFNIPANFELVDGQAVVRASESAQPADLKIQESRVQTDSKEQTHVNSCEYSGYCHHCGFDINANWTCSYGWTSSCSGTQEVLYRTDTFQRSLDLMISDGSQHLVVRTQGTPEFENTHLKDLSNCR